MKLQAQFLRQNASTRPGLNKRLVRWVDRLVTRTQEWMEDADSPLTLAVGIGIVLVTGLYVAGAIIKALAN